MNSVNPPKTYFEWMEVLDDLKSKSNDEVTLIAMQQGILEWQTGVAERFSKKLIDVINFRMNQAVDRFQRELNNAKGQERVIVGALLTLRKELAFLLKTLEIPSLPENYRNQCKQLIIDQANSIQKSLEDSSKADRSGKLSSIVRNNKVNVI